MRYFDLYLNLLHGEGGVVTIKRDVYYRNVIFFVQRVRDLVAFKDVDLVKVNLTILLHDAFLERYTPELDESDGDDLKKTLGIAK